MAAREAYSLYVERAVEGANEADGPLSSLWRVVDQRLEKLAGGGTAPVARALDAADQPALAIDQVRRRWTPDSVDAARHITGGVEEDGGHVTPLLRHFPHVVRTLAEVHEQDLEPLGLELPVQPIDGR